MVVSVPFLIRSWNISRQESAPIITSSSSFRQQIHTLKSTHTPAFFINHTQVIQHSFFQNSTFSNEKIPLLFSFENISIVDISQFILFSINSTAHVPNARVIESQIKYRLLMNHVSVDCSSFDHKVFSLEPAFMYFDLGRSRLNEEAIDYDILLYHSYFNTVKLYDSRSYDMAAPWITFIMERVTFFCNVPEVRLRLILNNKNLKNNFINAEQNDYKFFNTTNMDRLTLIVSNCYFSNIRFYVSGMNLLNGMRVVNSSFVNSVLEIYLIDSQKPSLIDSCEFTKYRNTNQSSSVTSSLIWYGTASVTIQHSTFIDNNLGIRLVSPIINNIQSVQIIDSKFINNTASIYCDSTLIALVIQTSWFINNNALQGSHFLSPFTIESAYYISISSCIFQNNRGTYGGAIMVEFIASSLNFADCDFKNNEAIISGGALYTNADSFYIRASEFSNNKATEDGGAIFSTSKNPSLYDVTFNKNTAKTGSGGAICIRNLISINTTVEVLNRRSTFTKLMLTKNTALSGKGGALSVHNAKMQVTGVIAFSNRAKIGGFIAMDASTLEFRNGLGLSFLIMDNVASQYGGAIAFTNCPPESLKINELAHLNFDMNQAKIAGGVFYIDETSSTAVVSNKSEHLLINFLDTSISKYGNTKASDPRKFLFKSFTMHDRNYTIRDMPFRVISNMPFSILFELLDAYGQTVIDFEGFIAEIEIIPPYNETIRSYSNLVLRSLDGTNFHFINLKFEFFKPNIPFRLKVKRSDSIQSIAYMEPLYLSMITSDCPDGQQLIQDNDSKSLICIACLPGFFKNGNTTTSCQPCPQGTFAEQPNQAQCVHCNFFSIESLTTIAMTSRFQCYISSIIITMILGTFLFCFIAVIGLAICLALSFSLRKSKKREKTALEEALLGSNHGHHNSVKDDIELSLMEQLMQSKYMIPFSELMDMEQIGSGAYGVVLRCKWKKQLVAVKMVRPGLHLDDQQLSDFYKEVELMAQLRHPHVVNFLGMCVSRQPSVKVGIVMEFCALGSLRSVIERHKNKLNWPQRINILLDISRGMHFLHSKKIIHRDLKIDNILITSKLNAKIADFGTSRTIEALEKVQQMTKRVGSSVYMSPEVVRGEPYNEKADIYSFGIIMFEVLMLQNAYQNFDWSVNIEWKVASDPNMRPQYPIDTENIIEELKQIQSTTRNLSSSGHNFDDLMEIPSLEEVGQYVEFSKRCWAHQTEERPSFDEAINFFESLSATLM